MLNEQSCNMAMQGDLNSLWEAAVAAIAATSRAQESEATSEIKKFRMLAELRV